MSNEQCWCGVKNPYFAPVRNTCGGHGVIDCYCGGDLCVCHWHGEVECEGCEDCLDHDDYDDCQDGDSDCFGGENNETKGTMVKQDFGWAIAQLKSGNRVARAGWNGRGMYLWLLPATTVKAEWCREPHLKAVAEANGGEIEALGSIRMMTADKKVLTGWLASQTDMLSEDWELVA